MEEVGGEGSGVVEEGEAAVPGGGGPVADDVAVQGHDRVEDTGVVVGVMGVVGMEDDVAALVADEVFVEGREEEDGAPAEAAGAGVRMDVEVASMPAFGAELVAEGGDAAPAVVDIQPGPPDEVLQRGGAMAAEIFAGEKGEGLFVVQNQRIAHLFRDERQRPFGRMEVPRAQQAGELRQAEMVGEPLLGHLDIPLAEGFREELLLHAAAPRKRLSENVGNPLFFLQGNIHAIGMHPATEPGQGLAAAELQHPSQVLAGNELPGGAQQVRPDDPSLVVGLLESLGGWLASTHRHSPAHGLVILGLHGPEPRHDLRRVFELRGCKLLAQKALGNGVHDGYFGLEADSEEAEGDGGAGFGVGEGVVVVEEVVAAGGGDGGEPVVREPVAEEAPRGREGVAEHIVGIVHPVHAEDGLQAAFVKTAVVRHQRQPFDQGLDPGPYIREHGRVLRVFGAKPMDLPAEPHIVFGFGVDEAVERVHDLSAADDDHADAAHAGGAVVGGFEVDGGEVKHQNAA